MMDVNRQFLTPPLLERLFTPSIIRSLTTIHEYRGRQRLHQEVVPDVVDALQTIAQIQSTESSNRIEGIYTSDTRFKELMRNAAPPRTRNEAEIIGYRDALTLIHEQHDAIPITPGTILQLHRDLFSATGLSYGGRWKDSDNAIIEIAADGSRRTRFKPTSALETPYAVERLCQALDDAREQREYDPLLAIAMFSFDFVSIHPFNDGNGRMSRLLLLLLLYQEGYTVGKYVSIEKAIEQSKQSYYETLRASSIGWHEGSNDYLPFVSYLLGVIVAVYRTFDEHVEAAKETGTGAKARRVERQILKTLGTFSKGGISQALPDVSVITIERALKRLLDDGRIEKRGGGRSTRYTVLP